MTKKTMLILFLLVFAGTCMADYSPQYGSYFATTMDADGNVTQTVVVDGTTTGDCYLNGGTYYIPNCPAEHSIDGYNALGSVGGVLNGPYGDMFSYFSYQSDVTAYIPDGAELTSLRQGRVWCAVGAAYIFDTGSVNDKFSVSHTYWKNPTMDAGGKCWYASTACATGTPSCTTQVGFLFAFTCPNYMHARYLKKGGACWFAVDTPVSGPGNCN